MVTAIAASLIARLQGELELAALLIEPVLNHMPGYPRNPAVDPDSSGQRDDDPLGRLVATVNAYPDNPELRLQQRVSLAHRESTLVQGLSLPYFSTKFPKARNS